MREALPTQQGRTGSPVSRPHMFGTGQAAVLAEQLALTISFHHLLAGLNDEVPGPCHEGLVVLAEIEAASRSSTH